MKRSPVDRLRTVVSAKLHGEHRYTQKELAASLGISVRTLRRFKNEPGHKLSARSVERIAEPVKALETSLRGFIRRRFHVPNTPVVQIPRATKFDHGESLTFEVDTWTLQDKINLLRGYYDQLKESGQIRFATGRGANRKDNFSHFTMYVKLPAGYVYARGDENTAGVLYQNTEVQNADKETQFYSTKPRPFMEGKSAINAAAIFHNDAGRNIDRIYIYIPAKKRKGNK